jgi:hypothetical protein
MLNEHRLKKRVTAMGLMDLEVRGAIRRTCGVPVQGEGGAVLPAASLDYPPGDCDGQRACRYAQLRVPVPMSQRKAADALCLALSDSRRVRCGGWMCSHARSPIPPAARVHTDGRMSTAPKKLRNRNARKWPLSDGQIPNTRVVRVSTGYNRVEGNRRASRSGLRVSASPTRNPSRSAPRACSSRSSRVPQGERPRLGRSGGAWTATGLKRRRMDDDDARCGASRPSLARPPREESHGAGNESSRTRKHNFSVLLSLSLTLSLSLSLSLSLTL